MLSDEEKNSMELDIEAKYVGRTEKEFLNNITYAECLYILDTKNKYCDDIKNLSLLKIVDIVNEQSKEIEEYKKQLDLDYVDKHFVPIERYNQLEKEIEELKEENKEIREWKYVIDNPIDLKKLSELDIIKIFDKSYIAKDIIKARIKELEEYLYRGSIKDDFLMIRIKAKIQELQSLLEKE